MPREEAGVGVGACTGVRHGPSYLPHCRCKRNRGAPHPPTHIHTHTHPGLGTSVSHSGVMVRNTSLHPCMCVCSPAIVLRDMWAPAPPRCPNRCEIQDTHTPSNCRETRGRRGARETCRICCQPRVDPLTHHPTQRAGASQSSPKSPHTQSRRQARFLCPRMQISISSSGGNRGSPLIERTLPEAQPDAAAPRPEAAVSSRGGSVALRGLHLPSAAASGRTEGGGGQPRARAKRGTKCSALPCFLPFAPKSSASFPFHSRPAPDASACRLPPIVPRGPAPTTAAAPLDGRRPQQRRPCLPRLVMRRAGSNAPGARQRAEGPAQRGGGESGERRGQGGGDGGRRAHRRSEVGQQHSSCINPPERLRRAAGRGEGKNALLFPRKREGMKRASEREAGDAADALSLGFKSPKGPCSVLLHHLPWIGLPTHHAHLHQRLLHLLLVLHAAKP